MTSDAGQDEITDDELSEFGRLRRRTWTAAAPYLVAAVLSWAAGGYSQYVLTKSYISQMSPDGPGSSAQVRQSILSSLSQVLFYAGLGFFLIGLLIIVLRQHERWRRDLDMSLDDDGDDDDMGATAAVTPPPDATPPDATPPYARSVWDAQPDEAGR